MLEAIGAWVVAYPETSDDLNDSLDLGVIKGVRGRVNIDTAIVRSGFLLGKFNGKIEELTPWH
jgi:hypothetical protein